MSDLTITELRLIAKNRNVKGYRGFSKKLRGLLRDLKISVKTVKKIELSSLSLSELKLIAKVRRIKNYEGMSKDELLSAFKNSILLRCVEEIRKKNCDKNKII